MTWLIKITLVLGALLATTACNTMQGVGEDVESVGEGISEVAKD